MLPLRSCSPPTPPSPSPSPTPTPTPTPSPSCSRPCVREPWTVDGVSAAPIVFWVKSKLRTIRIHQQPSRQLQSGAPDTSYNAWNSTGGAWKWPIRSDLETPPVLQLLDGDGQPVQGYSIWARAVDPVSGEYLRRKAMFEPIDGADMDFAGGGDDCPDASPLAEASQRRCATPAAPPASSPPLKDRRSSQEAPLGFPELYNPAGYAAAVMHSRILAPPAHPAHPCPCNAPGHQSVRACGSRLSAERQSRHPQTRMATRR